MSLLRVRQKYALFAEVYMVSSVPTVIRNTVVIHLIFPLFLIEIKNEVDTVTANVFLIDHLAT